MFDIGLKLWSTNTGDYMREAQRLYAEGVFGYIELFVVPDSVDALPLWLRFKSETSIPFVIHNAHSATGFNLADVSCTRRNKDIYLQTKAFADELDAQYIIFHGGVDGTIEEVVRQLNALNEPRALLENKPYLPLRGPDNPKVCRGASVDEIKYVLGAIGCGFCLDIGHAVCAANSFVKEPYSYIKELSALGPSMFHLSDVTDMSSQYDAHPHLGTGQLDIARLCRDVFPATAKISVETTKDFRSSLKDFEADVAWLGKCLKDKIVLQEYPQE